MEIPWVWVHHIAYTHTHAYVIHQTPCPLCLHKLDLRTLVTKIFCLPKPIQNSHSHIDETIFYIQPSYIPVSDRPLLWLLSIWTERSEQRKRTLNTNDRTKHKTNNRKNHIMLKRLRGIETLTHTRTSHTDTKAKEKTRRMHWIPLPVFLVSNIALSVCRAPFL